jgi:hypothetical protein
MLIVSASTNKEKHNLRVAYPQKGVCEVLLDPAQIDPNS